MKYDSQKYWEMRGKVKSEVEWISTMNSSYMVKRHHAQLAVSLYNFLIIFNSKYIHLLKFSGYPECCL